MDAADDEHWALIAELVTDRMVLLEYEVGEVAWLASVSAETLRRIRRGKSVSDAKLRGAARALAWPSDLLVRAARGEAVSEAERRGVDYDELDAAVERERTRSNQWLDDLRRRAEHAERRAAGR